MRTTLTLVLLLLAHGLARAKPSDCSSEAWAASLGHGAAIDCETLAAKTLAGRTLRVVQERSKPAADAATLAKEILAWSETALKKYRSYGAAITRDVTFALIPIDHEYEATANPLIAGGECVVFVYTAKDSVRDAARRAIEARFTIAHELVHCAQLWNAPAQMVPTERKWWSEGTAEYLAHTVFEDRKNVLKVFGDFVHESDGVQLTSLEYPTYALFAWYGQRHGPKGVMALWSRMPTVMGIAAQSRR